MPSCWVEQARCRQSRGRGAARSGSPFALLVGATRSCGVLDGQLSRSKPTFGDEDCQSALANRPNGASPGRGSRGEGSRSRDWRRSSIVGRRARQGERLAQQWRQQDDAALGERGCCGAQPNGGEARRARADGTAPRFLSSAACEPRPDQNGSDATARSAARLFASGGACEPRLNRNGSGAAAISCRRLIRAGRLLPSACRPHRQHAASPIRAQAEPPAAQRCYGQLVGYYLKSWLVGPGR